MRTKLPGRATGDDKRVPLKLVGSWCGAEAPGDAEFEVGAESHHSCRYHMSRDSEKAEDAREEVEK